MYTMMWAIYALLIAFVINIILCPIIIPFLTKLKFGQNVRDDGPKTHLVKAGTPTMGGIMVLISFIMASCIFLKNNPDGIALVLLTLGFGLVGFLDDYIKIVKKRSLGLRPYQKIILQLIFTLAFAVYVVNYTNIGTDIYIPFTSGKTIDLGMWYIPFAIIVILGSVNSVNLTDGLDGLASGVSVLVCVFFMLVAFAVSSSTLPVIGAIVGSLMGFLLFNSHPAKVFLGDTGSLAIGGFIGGLVIILKMPIFLVIVGLVYVMEAVSVMLQVGYFKLTKGKRIFKMAPIHHHFELCGLSETKVVTMFYIITAICCLVGYIASSNMFS